MSYTGMSEKSADGYGYVNERGVAASRRAGQEDLANAKKYKDIFQEVARTTGMDKYILAAIASRESRIKTELLTAGGMGGDGHGYGIMQVDDRWHNVDKSRGPASKANIEQGALILKDQIREKNDLQRGVAGYNIGNAVPMGNPDQNTTGGDYSNDVLTRAQFFREQY